VADPGRAQRLVERRPVLDAVAERLRDHGRVLAETFRRLALGPAAPVLLGLREVPVVEGGVGRDARFQQRVHQPVVEGQTGRVDRPAALRHDPRPGDGEAVRVEVEGLHQAQVLGGAVVVVAGDVAGVVAVDLAGGMGEGVPDGRGPAVLVHRALDLVRGGGRSPDEIGGKSAQVVHKLPFGRGYLTAPAVSPATR
jgi:hypothetical protein